jgi:hypothetical protein
MGVLSGFTLTSASTSVWPSFSTVTVNSRAFPCVVYNLSALSPGPARLTSTFSDPRSPEQALGRYPGRDGVDGVLEPDQGVYESYESITLPVDPDPVIEAGADPVIDADVSPVESATVAQAGQDASTLRITATVMAIIAFFILNPHKAVPKSLKKESCKGLAVYALAGNVNSFRHGILMELDGLLCLEHS